MSFQSVCLNCSLPPTHHSESHDARGQGTSTFSEAYQRGLRKRSEVGEQKPSAAGGTYFKSGYQQDCFHEVWPSSTPIYPTMTYNTSIISYDARAKWHFHIIELDYTTEQCYSHFVAIKQKQHTLLRKLRVDPTLPANLRWLNLNTDQSINSYDFITRHLVLCLTNTSYCLRSLRVT